MKSTKAPEPPADDTVVNQAALQLDEEDFDETDFDEEHHGVGDEVGVLNDPTIEYLKDAPMVGGSGSSDLFGESASTVGRAMSPRLYAQAAQFPTCSQLRIWKWENGIPVGLGAIDATATEEDLVQRFASAMPRKGEGRAQFKLRPIDIRGQEMGQEVTVIISEHHAVLQALRNAEDEESGEAGGSVAFGEMGRMFEQAVDAADRRNRMLEHALEDERRRVREEDSQRAQERVDLATSAAQGVQALTERMMKDESTRSQRAMELQNQQAQTLVTTLTSIFSQQQAMMQQSTESQRRADEFRLEQERQRADRGRRESEERARVQHQEWERKRQAERDEANHKLKMEREEAQRRFEQHRVELEARLQREREDMERKERREREEAERRDRWMAEERSRREERIGREQSEREAERNRQHERMMKDAETSAQRDREHAERMMQLSKIEMENKSNVNSMNILGNAAGMLKQFGIEPNEILPRLFQPPEEESNSWLEAIPKVLGVAAEVAKANMRPEPPMLRDLPPPPQLAAPPSGPQAMFGTPQPAQQPVLAEVGEPEPEGPPDPSKQPLSKLASDAGLGLKAQKSARIELRQLVRKLDNTDESEWQGSILAAIQREMAIYHYVRAVTVRAALTEGGAKEVLATRICNAMQDSSLVPDDLPYEWEDLA